MGTRASFPEFCSRVPPAEEFNCRALFHTDGRVELAAGHSELYLAVLWSGTWPETDAAGPHHFSRRLIPLGTMSAPYLFTNGGLGDAVAIIEHAGEVFIFVERSHMKSGPALDLPPVDFFAGPVQEAFRVPAHRYRRALNAIFDVFEQHSPLRAAADRRFIFSAMIEVGADDVLNFGLFDPGGESPGIKPVLTRNLSAWT